jgi:diguanylate cyclase (GGDEF)-like protein
MLSLKRAANNRSYSIVVVDDQPDNFDVIEALLTDPSYSLHYVASGQDALNSLEILQPDLLLLDVMMPDMDGIEVCRRIKQMPEWEGLPIIMVTALTTKADLARCLEAGADDFISKPVNRLELTARVRSMLRIRDQYQQLANFNSHLEHVVQQRTAQLQTLIDLDSLTTLPSRVSLLKHLQSLMDKGESRLAVVALDCDQFKLVNGSFGHQVGNQLLCAIAERLRQFVGPLDFLSRTNEDEFCIVLDAMPHEDALEPWIQNLLGCFVDPFVLEYCEIFLTACVGATLDVHSISEAEFLLQDADTAMYQAKLRGRGSYQLFDHQMHDDMLSRLTLESDLKRGFDHHEFIPFYQPIFHLPTQTLAGFEALVRWQHPSQGLIPPLHFIPSMEASGLIIPVGIEVLEQACSQLQQWHQQGHSQLTMSVNLSVRQFVSPTLLADIDAVLQKTQIDPRYLKLEITESAIMENTQAAIQVIKQLRERQIQISIDDFGTGYSSLGCLHQFPVDILKIDRTFIAEFSGSANNYPVVEIILTLSKHLQLAVVAEGIETQAQSQWLKDLGCEFGQGYYFSKPLPAAEIAAKFLASASS